MVRSLFLFDTISFDDGETYILIVSVLLIYKLSIDINPVTVFRFPIFRCTILTAPSAPVVYECTVLSVSEPKIGESIKLRIVPLYTQESELIGQDQRISPFENQQE